MSMLRTRQIPPFGLEVLALNTLELSDIPVEIVKTWIAENRLLVLRDFPVPRDDDMLDFCKSLGSILEWEFGSVNELKVKPDTRNYLYTNRDVPFHWDGAFAGKVPHYIFFHCELAPPAGSGGETVFCDTSRMFRSMTEDQRRRWQSIRITYATEKVVHYGGRFTASLFGRHPQSGEPTIRFAEPVADLNPVSLEIDGLPAAEHRQFLDDMTQLLRDPKWFIAHTWQTGDIVIADNHALLHGRNAFTQPAQRHLRRVNIL